MDIHKDIKNIATFQFNNDIIEYPRLLTIYEFLPHH